MQTDEDVGKVAAAVPVVISRALELFIDSLIMKSAEHTKARNAKTLSASHIKQIILAEKKFDFLKDLVANIPDVQATEDDGPECSTDHPPPKPRAKLPPLAPGQPPRPRGRPKKKQEEEGSTATATPVKQSHIDEEIKYSGESEGSSSEFEESDTEGKSSISTDTTTAHTMPSVYPEQQPNLPGSSSHLTSPTTFHTLLPATIPMSVDDSVTAPIPETFSALESQNILDQTNSVKYDTQNVGQTQQDTAAPTPVLFSLERANTAPSVKGMGIVSPPNISVQTSSPHTVSTTTTSSVSGQFSGYTESSTTPNSWGLPDHQISKPPLNAASSAISLSSKTMNEAMVSDAYREAYQRISETSDSTMGTSGDSRVLNTSPLSSSSNTAVFLKDQKALYGDPSRTGEMKHGLPEPSHMKPHLFEGVQNGGNAISGQLKAMHSNQLHLETNMGQGTFEKWSPTKAGVLDLSVNKKVKAEVKTQEDMTSRTAPLNLAVTQDYTQNSNKDSTIHDRDTKSHITSQEVNKPITGQHNSELKGGTIRASTPNTNVEKSAPVTSMNMTGYPPSMMGLPGYPVIPGFPAYGMMPPYNGPNQFGGMTPQVMPPYASPSGFYLPYQAAMMGYNPTTPSEKHPAQQSEKPATKPS